MQSVAGQRTVGHCSASIPGPHNPVAGLLSICRGQPAFRHVTAQAAPVKKGSRPSVEATAPFWGKLLQGSKSTAVAPVKKSNRRELPRQPEEEEQESWGVLDWSRYGRGWAEVPWGLGRTVGGTVLWFASFVAVGLIAVPGLYKLTGTDLSALPPDGKALFTLVAQLLETVVGLSVIRVLTAGPLDEAGSPEDPADQLFNFSLQNPFKAPYGWAAWALGGIALSPLVVGVTANIMASSGWDASVGGKGTVDGVAAMLSVSLPTYGALIAVTGVLAPILEETVFRGFLLTSLTRVMPTWAAIFTSSLFFGLAHLSARDLPVLITLGALLGVSYVRSRNLLTPMLIHGAWNSSILTLLFALTASGVDVDQILKDVR